MAYTISGAEALAEYLGYSRAGFYKQLKLYPSSYAYLQRNRSGQFCSFENSLANHYADLVDWRREHGVTARQRSHDVGGRFTAVSGGTNVLPRL